jgi:hypothetical protein
MDLLRSVGGVLFAVGAVLVLARKSGHHGWGDFARLLVVLVPAVLLYVLALGGTEGADGAEGGGVRGTESARDEHARPWQSVLVVIAILLVPVVLLEFLAWVGANTGHVLYGAGIFALTALFAGYAARRARASYAALLAGLSLLLTWLLVWEKILGHPSANTYRWLLVAAAVLLFVFAARLARAGAIGSSELATAGGIAAVMAGVLGVIIGSFVSAFSGLSRALSTASETSNGSGPIGGSGSIIGLGAGKASVITRTSGTFRGSVASRASVIGRASGNIRGSVIGRASGTIKGSSAGGGSIRGVFSRPRLPHIHVPHVTGNPHVPLNLRIPRNSPILRNPRILRNHHISSNPFAIHTNGLQHFGWDLYLLVVSLALVWIGSRVRARGLGYVGGVGLLAFLVSVGEQVTRLESGHAPTTSIVGWPLALLIIGLVGLAAPILSRRES